jgi:hypothetical protein
MQDCGKAEGEEASGLRQLGHVFRDSREFNGCHNTIIHRLTVNTQDAEVENR